jgi:hypothetical protein
MTSVLAEVLPVGNNAREPLPMLAHNGTQYVIAEPGTECELRVKIVNAKANQRYRVSKPQQCCPAGWPQVLLKTKEHMAAGCHEA